RLRRRTSPPSGEEAIGSAAPSLRLRRRTSPPSGEEAIGSGAPPLRLRRRTSPPSGEEAILPVKRGGGNVLRRGRSQAGPDGLPDGRRQAGGVEAGFGQDLGRPAVGQEPVWQRLHPHLAGQPER